MGIETLAAAATTAAVSGAASGAFGGLLGGGGTPASASQGTNIHPTTYVNAVNTGTLSDLTNLLAEIDQSNNQIIPTLTGNLPVNWTILGIGVMALLAVVYWKHHGH